MRPVRSILRVVICLVSIAMPVVWAQEEAPGELRINEVSFAPAPDDDQWVELYNGHAEALDLSGYILQDQDGNTFALPSGLNAVPSGAFVVVFFDGASSLSDDYDFGDNAAWVHSDANFVDPLGLESGQVALYRGSNFNRDTIVSYVAWGDSPGPNAMDAVLSGLWESEDTVISVDTLGEVEGPAYRLPDGGSVGVYPNEEVTTLAHWAGYAPNLATPGAPNAGPAPAIYLPENAVLFENGNVNFSWSAIPGTSRYHLQIDHDRTFSAPEINEDLLVFPSFDPDPPLSDGVYFWRVRAFDANTIPGAWSEARELRIGYADPNTILFALGVSALQNANGVSGTVTDAVSGNGLQGVTLTLSNGAGSTVTGASGAYAFPNLPNGTYTATATLANYKNAVTQIIVTGGSVTANLPMTGNSKVLGVPALAARKDGRLLCIDGCSELSTTNDRGEANHHWDGSHVPRARWGTHERMYCTPTAAAMIARYLGGNISIEEISYELWKGGGPESDLGHNKGHTVARQRRSLTFALQTAVGNLNEVGNRPTDAQLIGFINANRPMRYSTGGHAMVVDGYRWTDRRLQARFLNTDNNGTVQWFFWKGAGAQPFVRAWIPNAGLSGRNTDPDVTKDSDGDGVVDFDENKRFQSVKNHRDTDLDEVEDKDDIRQYTFHRFYHPAHRRALPAALYDIDRDNKRSENDCDSDNDAHFDGGEDYNGNGHNPESIETCVYDPAAKLIFVHTDKQVYFVGETVSITASVLHEKSTYPFEIKTGCPDLKPNDVLSQTGTVTSDDIGNLPLTPVFTCTEPGQFLVVLDVLKDGRYSEPDNWDPWECFECKAVETGIPYIDPANDVLDLFNGVHYDDPGADIIGGTIDPQNGVITVKLAGSFGMDDFSYAIIVYLAYYNSPDIRGFIEQIHDTVPLSGEFDYQTFQLIPDSSVTMDYARNVGDSGEALLTVSNLEPSALQPPLQLEVIVRHLQSEDGVPTEDRLLLKFDPGSPAGPIILP